MKIFNITIAILFLLSFNSCSKDGSEGPLGPKGEQGIQGAQGIPGTDGNMLLHGTGAPKTTHGEIGDFYIDKASSNLYGPKTTSGWGASTNLKGAKGDSGATGSKGDRGETGAKGDKGQDGSQFLSGSAAPTTQGKNGDFYFHTTTATLYGPKAASGWGTGISLRGPKGDKGDKGAKGDDGTMLRHGIGVPASTLGNENDFYIDISTSNLYGPKKTNGWGTAISLKGTKGDKGDTGSGGAKGEDGSQFLSGAAVPINEGKLGDFYFHTSATTLYGPKTASGWGAGISLKGQKGDKGDKGDPGNANVVSTGWIKFPASAWSTALGRGSVRLNAPNDIGSPYHTQLTGVNRSEINGAILVYVDDGYGVRLCPHQRTVNESGKVGSLEFRFVHDEAREGFSWAPLYASIALRSGEWDHNYIKNTYLPSLKWKVVTIPASQNLMMRSVNTNDYQAVKRALRLKN